MCAAGAARAAIDAASRLSSLRGCSAWVLKAALPRVYFGAAAGDGRATGRCCE